jgi:hypothetical protein
MIGPPTFQGAASRHPVASPRGRIVWNPLFTRWLPVAVFALAMSWVAPLHADSGAHSLSINWHRERLSVWADGMPYGALLAAIARTTGAEFRGLESLDGMGSVHFADLPLVNGLKVLLTDIDHAMIEVPSVDGADARMVVVVVGRKEVVSAGTSGEYDRDQALGTSGTLADHRPDDYLVVERLAEQGDIQALRKAAAFGDPMIRTLAMRHLARQDPAEAQRLAIDAARSEAPTERALAVHVLGGLDSLEATNALGAALLDPDATVRLAALVGFMGQKSSTATQFLWQATQDDSEPIRLLALELLAQRSGAEKPGVPRALGGSDGSLHD